MTKDSFVSIALCGFLGRMGSSIIEVSKSYQDLVVKAGVDKEELIKDKTFALEYVSSKLEDVVDYVDVVIEFTGSVDTAIKNTYICKEYNKSIVIGTTGFDQHQLDQMKELSKSIPIVFSPNMSLGVNVLFKLLEIAAKALKDKGYDIEISEIHHRFKKDAPSGTALRLLEIVKKEISNLKETFGREGLAPRQDNEVGVFAIRGGDVVGEHTVYMFGMGERLELTHRATDRRIFAKGSLEAAKWVYRKPAGFYSMFDVLGL
jgi:dihydrodipicolinate reductase (EC 1.3.1.26)